MQENPQHYPESKKTLAFNLISYKSLSSDGGCANKTQTSHEMLQLTLDTMVDLSFFTFTRFVAFPKFRWFTIQAQRDIAKLHLEETIVLVNSALKYCRIYNFFFVIFGLCSIRAYLREVIYIRVIRQKGYLCF